MQEQWHQRTPRYRHYSPEYPDDQIPSPPQRWVLSLPTDSRVHCESLLSCSLDRCSQLQPPYPLRQSRSSRHPLRAGKLEARVSERLLWCCCCCSCFLNNVV